ncbi:MAG: MYXO-CTERM sorting domain-containing protein, partial [Sandaracinaceae bacterium]
DLDVFNGTLEDLMGFVGTMPVCGDGFCSGGETPESCAMDCPVCNTVPPLGRDVDESELCFERGGPSMYLRDVPEGWLDTLVWTHATDSATPANYGVWHLAFDEAGRYRIDAHVPAPWGESTMTRYDVHHAGMDASFVLDQSMVDGWTTLGDVYFEAGGDQWVRVNDNTGEPVSSMTQIVFDALRLTRLDPPMTDASVPDDAGFAPDAAMGDGGVTMPGDAGGPVMDAGCSCRAAPRASAPLGWLVALALVFVRIRRRPSTR